jgi:hypothetical protein
MVEYRVRKEEEGPTRLRERYAGGTCGERRETQRESGWQRQGNWQGGEELDAGLDALARPRWLRVPTTSGRRPGEVSPRCPRSVREVSVKCP